MTAVAHRSEHDLLGHRDVPAEAYWGVHTLRARENVAITGTPIAAYPHLAAVKEAAAIVEACREIRDGKLHDQFVVDVIQGGAGTSTDMNANEVIADRALELLGHARGEYGFLHPNEDVKIATVYAVRGLLKAMGLIHEINLGATAIGTGLNSPAGYAESVRRHLSQITGLSLVTAVNLVEATQDCGAFVQVSGVLKRIAVKLSKTCNDLRLLSSGPRAGLNEINLPPVQAGSSVMPGKINPVIPEVVDQVAFEVTGNDVVITMAAEAGQLQLNASALTERCVAGITADTEVLRAAVENSIGTGRGVAELVLDKGLLPAGTLAQLLRPEAVAGPGQALA
ncbi:MULTISPECIES: lyase family protein [unclassified Streptomyces]|uniref:lyase family protein n=1 Tax=unclassified Streptomyces TaxID=2593676 RepID=UPI000DD4EF81|nr:MULTISPECIES: lyase family protein [unclassified Streptomyces]QZZ30723.1 aspartate ammonia-lyase [Streptomyces sp. ST1015]